MKKLLFIAALFVCSILQGQSLWNVLWYYDFMGPRYNNVYISGDTIVYEDIEYTELFKDGELCGIYRESDMRTYCRTFRSWNSSYSDEYLLYDYSVAIGDTIVVNEWGQELIVENITEETWLNGEVKRKIFLSYPFAPNIIETWVEGAGSNYGFILSGRGLAYGDMTILLCYHIDNELIWQNPDYDYCSFTSIDEFEEPQVSLYPNPGENILNIQTSLQNARVEVYDVLGNVVYEQEITGDVISISTDKWAKGMYFWRVFSNEKEVENGKWIKQ